MEAALAELNPKPPVIAMEGGGYEAWRDAQTNADPGPIAAPEDTALLLYTSGTTGRPKGVMLTSANILRSRADVSRARMGWNEWEEGEVSLVAMPVAHIGGSGWGIVGLLNGIKNVVARDFNPMEALEFIERGA